MPDFASISASRDAIAAGSLIVVVDDDSETATGALAGAAQFMDTEKLVWLSRRVTGLIGVPMQHIKDVDHQRQPHQPDRSSEEPRDQSMTLD